MPTYRYRCPQGHEWEELRSITADTATSQDACPTCVEAANAEGIAHLDAELIGKQVPPSSVSVHFKGTGWTPKFYRDKQ